MRFLNVLACALLLLPAYGYAADTLTVQQCRELAVQNSPLQVKKLYAESISALQLANLHSNNLPHISIGAQATWQSDVFGLPIESPFFQIPTVPKDQYKLSVEVGQRIWDGGSDRYLRQQRGLENALAAAQVDVEVFALREVVTDLYFKALLLQESEAVLLGTRADLQNRLRQAEALVTEGVALRTSADQVKIQILKTDQLLVGARADKQALLDVLAQWVGKAVVPKPLVQDEKSPSSAVAMGASLRPEYQLFALQQRSLQLGKDALALHNQPRVEAFVQGGLGRPNPFNFFETGFQPFVLLGLRAVWTPLDWGNRSRDAQVFDWQMKNVAAQQQSFDQRLAATTLKDRADATKMRDELVQDDAIIRLQTDIISRADAQVKNGVMTMTDYLTQIEVLTQARLLRVTHLVQMVQAREMLVARIGEGK
ncbi:MAG: TolC family protein [Saprospiraceae bacterium]